MTRDRKRGGHGFREGVLQALYLMVGLVIAFPIIYAFFISFMEPSQVLAGGVNLIPKKWTLENYKTALNSAPIMRFMWNSLILATVSSIVRVIVSAMAAFAFAFLEFPCKNLIFMAMLGHHHDSCGCGTGCQLPDGFFHGMGQHLFRYDGGILCVCHEYIPVAAEL